MGRWTLSLFLNLIYIFFRCGLSHAVITIRIINGDGDINVSIDIPPTGNKSHFQKEQLIYVLLSLGRVSVSIKSHQYFLLHPSTGLLPKKNGQMTQLRRNLIGQPITNQQRTNHIATINANGVTVKQSA